MSKRLGAGLLLSLVFVLLLVALSCAPTAAPAPKPTPAPGAPKPAAPQTPGAAEKAPAPAAPRKVIDMAAPWGPAASPITTQAMVFSKLLKDHSDFLRLSPMLVSGYPKGVEYYQKNKEQGYFVLIFTGAMMAEYARGVRTYEKDGPRQDMSLMWVPLDQPIFLVSRLSTGIKTSEQLRDALKAGKKIAIGEPGTNSFLMSTTYIEEGLGIKKGEYKAITAGIADIISMMREGTVDLASWAAAGSKTLPHPYLEDLTSSVKCNFIPVTQAQLDAMNKSVGGGDVYNLQYVPAGRYRGLTFDVGWPFNPQFLVLPKTYPDDIAYELSRIWWGYRDQGIEMSNSVALADPAMTKDALKKKWDFGWHAGALKYYKEKGWT